MVRIRPWAPRARPRARRQTPGICPRISRSSRIPQEIRNRLRLAQTEVFVGQLTAFEPVTADAGKGGPDFAFASLDRTNERPIRCFADRDCDQESQPNPPVLEKRPSDRSLRRAKSHVRVVGALRQRRLEGSRLENRARWQRPPGDRGRLGANRGEPAFMKLQPASGSRGRTLSRERHRRAQARRWRKWEGGFREANDRKLPGSSGRSIGI